MNSSDPVEAWSRSSSAPLVPSDINNPGRAVFRACWATLQAMVKGGAATDFVKRTWPSDPITPAFMEQRAAMTAGTTTTAGWLSEICGTALADYIGSLAPLSAAAELVRRGLVLRLDGIVAINIPDLIGSPVPAVWIGEGLPIPAAQMPLANATLRARKMGCLVTWSRELQRLSSAATVFESLLREKAAASFDSAYFSTLAGDAVSHQGLLYNVTPLTGGAVIQTDLMALAEAVAPASPNTLVYIAAPGRAAAVSVRADVSVTMLPSLAIAANAVVAVDVAALVHAFDGAPDILPSSDATLHLSDTPTDIGTVGTPNVVAAPVSSMFQVAAYALRLLIDCAFAKRRPGCVQIVSGCTW
jgi:hypothetical protein